MRKIKLYPILFVLQLVAVAGFAQQKTILKILNRELAKEAKARAASAEISGDSLAVIQSFTINNNRLSLIVKEPLADGFQLVSQEVLLTDIKEIAKDANIIFKTADTAVTTVTTYTLDDGTTTTYTGKDNMFFTQLRSIKRNETLATELKKAFKKAGIIIETSYWAD